MAHLAIAGSHSVNGVAALHSEILKNELFRDFYEMYPEKFNNKTNGITQRRWLKMCNPALSALIDEYVGPGWTKDLYQLEKLKPLASDPELLARWQQVKRSNKEALCRYIKRHNDIEVDPDSLFDVQVKRMHEYKRQLLNVLHVVTLYNRIKDDPQQPVVPRTFIFGGKAAPSYVAAKLTIRLINAVASVVNRDPDVAGRIKVVFLANYGVSLAEKIFPAADLSEQISTAGTEASGTGNMKFALNGALTIGTLDGANIEIMEEVARENIFIFGLTAQGVAELRSRGYNPREYYNGNKELKRVIDMIACGFFSPAAPELFTPLTDGLLNLGDHYMLLADYAPYVACQQEVSALFRNQQEWTRRAILNTAGMGKFSSDRTIQEYAREIWGIRPVSIRPGMERP